MKRHMLFKKVCCGLLAGLIAAIPARFARAEQTDEVITPPYYDTVTITQGTLNIDAKVYVRKGPGKDYGRVGKLSPGDVFTVTGTEGDWYQIEFDGGSGYVLAELVNTSTFEDQVEHVDEAAFEADITDADYPVVLERKSSYSLRGTVTSSTPLTAVIVKVINQVTLEEEINAQDTFDRSKNVTSYDLLNLDNYIKFRKLTPGEKRLLVIAQSGNASKDVLDVNFFVTGNSTDEPVSMTDRCTFDMAHGKAAQLTDGKLNTGWQPTSDTDALTITLPESPQAGVICLTWTEGVRNYTLECYDRAGELVETVEANYSYDMYSTSHNLSQNLGKLVLTTNNLTTTVAEVRLYEADKVSSFVPRWSESNKKADLMVISAHEGDELLFFGGLIPTAVGEGKNVEAVFLSGSGRDRLEESLEAMWTAGLTNAPVYLGFEEQNVRKYEDAVNAWDLETAVSALVERIRATQPDVIVTHNVNGEDGDNQHTYTATLVRRAVLLAADPASYPDSYSKYGAWEVKKLYIHQYEANTVQLNYEQPLDAFGSLTANQVTELAYDKYASLRKHSLSYYNEKFEANSYGLIASTVGEDSAKTDLFEHIEG